MGNVKHWKVLTNFCFIVSLAKHLVTNMGNKNVRNIMITLNYIVFIIILMKQIICVSPKE